jgi:hypothetical protein
MFFALYTFFLLFFFFFFGPMRSNLNGTFSPNKSKVESDFVCLRPTIFVCDLPFKNITFCVVILFCEYMLSRIY